ncbi:MAG: hypothetical protein LUC19_03270 [Oscillospiraceae bacterium]|nr:hypothetical protein [Oscillospiraceae bacterium]
MYNRYKGNTGEVRRVEEQIPQPQTPRPQQPASPPAPSVRHSAEAAQPMQALSSELNKLMQKLSPMNLETEDILLALIIYLMYRESGDRDMLIILGAMLFM